MQEESEEGIGIELQLGRNGDRRAIAGGGVAPGLLKISDNLAAPFCECGILYEHWLTSPWMNNGMVQGDGYVYCPKCMKSVTLERAEGYSRYLDDYDFLRWWFWL